MAQDILVEALIAEGIPLPCEKITHNHFTRWGKKDRFWAKCVCNGYIYGDFARAISRCVFPFAEERVSYSFIEIRQKALAQERLQAAVHQENYWRICADRALHIWQNAKNIATHPYLERKQIKPCDLRASISGSLIIPLSDVSGKIWTLQFINETGKKFLMKGGLKKGHFYMFGKPQKRIFLCEGYATAATVYQTVNDCTVACIDAGNLIEVGSELRVAYPNTEMIFCADNDQFSAFNVGYEKAIQAARAVKGRVIYPFFTPKDKRLLPTDFNDLACLNGTNEVRRQLTELWGVKL